MTLDIELSNKSLLDILLFKSAVSQRWWSRAIGNEEEKNVPTMLENNLSSCKAVLLALKSPKTTKLLLLFPRTVSCKFGVNVVGELFDGKKMNSI